MSLQVLGRSLFTHRSPSHDYLTIWRDQKIEYLSQMHCAGQRMSQSPHLINQILKLEAAMKRRNLVPFVHATPASSKVILQFSDVVYPTEKVRFFTPLRPRDEEFAISLDEVKMQIPKDVVRKPKYHLLSVSYALTSGIRPLESAASWGFVNHFGNAQNFTMLHRFRKLLQHESTIAPHVKPHFHNRAWRLIRHYGRLEVGDFYVLGVPPEKLRRYLYDSKPDNLPTGKDIHSVAADPYKHIDSLMEEKTHMATMLICDETLASESGLCIINAHDDEAVLEFCSKMEPEPLQESKLYQQMLKLQKSEFEKKERTKRKSLDRDLEVLVNQFAELKIGKSVDFSARDFDDEFSIADFPESEF
jgi:hypothetical protein